MHGNGWDHMGSWGWAGMLLMLFFWISIAVLIVWALGSWRAGDRTAIPARPPDDPAMTILRERFARGEMTADEFEEARQTLVVARERNTTGLPTA